MYTINILLKLLGEPRHLGLYLLSLSFYALQFITQFKYFFAAIGFVYLFSPFCSTLSRPAFQWPLTHAKHSAIPRHMCWFV